MCKNFEANFEILLKDSPVGVKQELIEIIEIEFDYPSFRDSSSDMELENESLVVGLMCLRCAFKVTQKYLNMLIGCKLSSLNVAFKAENDQRKKSKRFQKSKRLNIPRYAAL